MNVFWMRALVIAGLFVALYHFNLLRLWQYTAPLIGDPNWAHSVLVPCFGLFYLFIRRDELFAAPVKPLLGLDFTKSRLIGGLVFIGIGLVGYFVGGAVLEGQTRGLFALDAVAQTLGMAVIGLGVMVLLFDWGLGSLFFGLLVSAAGIYIKNNFIWDVGMVATLFGIVLTMCGWRVMKIAWFPIVFLLCALPWPEIIYSQVAMPLQHLAAQVAVIVLNLVGVLAEVSGTVIIIPMPDGQPEELGVEEACAGMRSLMTFITLAAAIAFVFQYDRPLWQRVLLTLTAIPIAILSNTVRVAGMGLLYRFVSEDYAVGFAHSFTGLVMMIPAFFLILGAGWVLDNLFIEEVDQPAAPTKPANPSNSSKAAPATT
jgi:exosortase